MICPACGAEELMDLLLGDLAPEDQARVTAHVAACAVCQDSLETLRHVHEVAWACREFRDVRVPPEVHAQILEKCRAALAAVQAMRQATPLPPTVSQRLALERASRRQRHPRRLVYLGIALTAAVVFFIVASFVFHAPPGTAGVVEMADAHVLVLRPGEREGIAVGDGFHLREGHRLRTDRLASKARVALAGGGTVRLGGRSTVRFLGGGRVELLSGRMFLETAGRSVSAETRSLVASASHARFDLRLIDEPEAMPAGGLNPSAEVLLTVVAGSVRYQAGQAQGSAAAGEQVRLSGNRLARRKITPHLFYSDFMTDEECDTLPAPVLRRLIRGPTERLEDGRVRLTADFGTPEAAADWSQTAGEGTWRQEDGALVGEAQTGQRALIYHTARFTGEVSFSYEVDVDARTPRAQTLWRLYADRTEWGQSGFSGYVGVETIQDDRPVRNLSLYYLSQTQASRPALTLTGFAYPVQVASAAGRIAYRAGDEPALECPLGQAPDNGHCGLGVAGGTARFRRVTIVGRLQPRWIRFELERLGAEDLKASAAALAYQPVEEGLEPVAHPPPGVHGTPAEGGWATSSTGWYAR